MDIEDNFHKLKVILVGMSGSGKTSLINILMGEKFKSIELTTSSPSFAEKQVTLNDKIYKLEIWDTAGQEKFYSLTKIFIKESKIVIFVYDITSKQSFEEIDFWVKSVKDILGEEAIFGLAGNKKDLFLQEKVSEDEGIKKAEKIGALFKLTSAKTGFGIKEFMMTLLEEYIKTHANEIDIRSNISSKLSVTNNKKKKKCCK
jgi:small GTP-binding protein